MKIQFNIELRPQIESGEYKVVTDVGEPVEVVKWDCKGKYPILAVIDDGDTHDSCFYDEKGVSYSGKESICVLTNEPELTEFEEAVQGLMNGVNNGFTLNIKEEASILIGIARKQLEKEKVAQLKNTEAYNMGLIDGNAEALKDMPKWKRSVTGIAQYEDACIIYENRAGTDFSKNVLILKCGLMQVDIEELKKKLPKEE